jgi:hypothetical protein
MRPRPTPSRSPWTLLQLILTRFNVLDEAQRVDSTRLNQFVNTVTGSVGFLGYRVGNMTSQLADALANLTVVTATTGQLALTSGSTVATVAVHRTRLDELEGLSSTVVISTQALANSSSAAASRTNQIQLELNDLFSRVIPMRQDVNYAQANVTVLNSQSAALRTDVALLQSRVTATETSLDVAVPSLAEAVSVLGTTSTRSLSNTARIVALETAGDVSVVAYVKALGCSSALRSDCAVPDAYRRPPPSGGVGVVTVVIVRLRCTTLALPCTTSLNSTRSAHLPLSRYKTLTSHTGIVYALAAINPDGWVASAAADRYAVVAVGRRACGEAHAARFLGLRGCVSWARTGRNGCL